MSESENRSICLVTEDWTEDLFESTVSRMTKVMMPATFDSFKQLADALHALADQISELDKDPNSAIQFLHSWGDTANFNIWETKQKTDEQRHAEHRAMLRDSIARAERQLVEDRAELAKLEASRADLLPEPLTESSL